MTSSTTDQSAKLVTLEEFVIEAQSRFPHATGEMTQLLMDITAGGQELLPAKSIAAYSKISTVPKP